MIGKKIIYGCEERGDAQSPYLTRFTLIDWPDRFQLCLHVFHRSDGPDLHDHPWGFVTLPIWRGYVEETPCFCGDGTDCDYVADRRWVCTTCRGSARIRRRAWPLIPLFRRATHVHRVELIDGKRAVTLILMGPRVRVWRFLTPEGWVDFKSYFRSRGC